MAGRGDPVHHLHGPARHVLRRALDTNRPPTALWAVEWRRLLPNRYQESWPWVYTRGSESVYTEAMTTTAATTYAMRGNGRAIHVATTNYAGELVTLCDTIHYGWNRSKGATRLVKANAATCRKCLAVTNA